MQIVVNHLTKMRGERICVAGVDPTADRHIRPTTSAAAPLTRELLDERGGPFSIGAMVDLGRVSPCGDPPETEDHRFSPWGARGLGTLSGDQYLELLDRVSANSLEDAFGPSLERATKWKYAVPFGQGERSLAVVRARSRCRLRVDDMFQRVELQFTDVDPQTYLTVTDLRLFEADQQTNRQDVVGDVATRLARGTDAFIMFGLSRAFLHKGDDQERHWLQVNGLCLFDRPTGDVP